MGSLTTSVRGGSLRGNHPNANDDSDRLRQLAVGIAHNFNNLLTSMMCGSGLALDRLAEDHPARGAVELVSQSSEQAAALVRKLMAYAGICPFMPAPQDLSRLAARVINSMRPTIPSRVELRVDLAANLPLVQVDATGIVQLIRVLLTNAFEAIGDGAGTVSITTRTGRADRLPPGTPGDTEGLNPENPVCLEVADTGCGMDDWVMRRIFDPFFSTKSLGRGLGLSAAAGIARAHGGVIGVESAPGHGSAFRVYLPGRAQNEAAREPRAA